MLSCSLYNAPSIISLSERDNRYDETCLDITFTYVVSSSESVAEMIPITLYRPSLFVASSWAIQRHTSNGLVTMKKMGSVSLPATKEPRLLSAEINIVDFISLSPGQSWSDRIPIDDDELAESFQAGEKYTFQFTGTIVQWWDLGTLQVNFL